MSPLCRRLSLLSTACLLLAATAPQPAKCDAYDVAYQDDYDGGDYYGADEYTYDSDDAGDDYTEDYAQDEYDYTEDGLDIVEEQYEDYDASDLQELAQSYDYSSDDQAELCIEEVEGQPQVLSPELKDCEMVISGADDDFQAGISTVNGVYYLTGCRKGFPYYVRAQADVREEGRMLWFSPEYFDWTISSTDDKSLAAKTRYLLAYGGSTFLDNSNLTITNEWHVIRAIAKDDVFKSTFDVSCRVSGDSEAADADTLADLPEVGSTEEYAPAAEDSVPEADATPIADAAAVEVQAPIQDAATKETALAAEPSTPAEDSAPEAYAPVIEDAAGKAPEESVPAAEDSLLEADGTPADDAAAEVADQAEEAAQDAGIEDRAPEEVELPAKDAGQETKESIQDAVPFQMSRKYGHTISAALNPESAALTHEESVRKFEESQQESGPLSADAVASYVVPIAFAAVMAFVVIGVLGYRRIAGKPQENARPQKQKYEKV